MSLCSVCTKQENPLAGTWSPLVHLTALLATSEDESAFFLKGTGSLDNLNAR